MWNCQGGNLVHLQLLQEFLRVVTLDLFILFVNDVTRIFKAVKFVLYADDLKLFYRVETVLDCIALQRDLEALSQWINKNYFILNVENVK